MMNQIQISASQKPWDVAVPVAEGSFRSVFPAHEECNVVTAPEAIGSFGAGQSELDANGLLFADLQANLHTHITGRLGSGRSGVYRGWYLKGVGRTPLAANWNHADHLHNTGHLAASSAIREFVASIYMSELGFDHTIVPCCGVLLSPLDPQLEQLNSLLYHSAPEAALPAVDRHMQAITVKASGFARMSNFLWLLYHLSPCYVSRGDTGLSTFTELLTAALVPPDELVPPAEAVDSEYLAGLLGKAVHRACENFRIWFRAGIWWGSFANNLTLDGRFLDLETPAIAGGPFIGVLNMEDRFPEKPSMCGGTLSFDVLFYLAQMRWFCETLSRLLEDLPPTFPRTERTFAAELADAIRQGALRRDGLLVSRERAVSHVLSMIVEESNAQAGGSLSPRSCGILRELLEVEYESNFAPPRPYRDQEGHKSRTYRRPPLVPLTAIPWVVTEPGVSWRFNAFRLNGPEAIIPEPSQQAIARGINELIAELDATTELHALREHLAQTPQRIRDILHQGPLQGHPAHHRPAQPPRGT